jgi:ribonuclease E
LEVQSAVDSADEQGKPRKRPNDMKRTEPQRRRRNRGRRPEGQGGVAEADVLQSPNPELEASALAAEPLESVVSSRLPESGDEGISPVQNAAVEDVADSTLGEEGWESVPFDGEQPESAVEDVVITERSAPKVVSAPVLEAPSVIVSMDGLTAGGRAINDPRVNARPVGEVAVTTSRRAMFGETMAPPVSHSGRIATRASNDPRGPRPAVPMAHAAGQS